MAYRQQRGTQRERDACEMLRQRGWFAEDSRGSHGPADVIALRDGHTPMLIQVKSDAKKYGPFNNFGPSDRAQLRADAKIAGAVPMLLYKPPHARSWTWVPENGWPD